jgi:drug/metabolite transporter (DMT)-like permease
VTSDGPPAPDTHSAIVDPWLAVVALIWGGNFVTYKVLLASLPATGLLAVRFVVVTALLLLVLWVTGRLRRNEPGMWLQLFLAGVLIMGVQQLMFVHGLNLTAAGEGALLFATAPIFTALMVAAAGTEAITPSNWVGVIAAFLGTAMVILGGGAAAQVSQARITGDLLMLGSAILYALFMALSKGLMERYGALKVVTFSYLFGGLVVVPFGAREALAADWAGLSGACWFCLSYLIVLAGVFGFVTWYWRISRTSAARVAVYQYVVPVVALIAAAIWLAERPTAIQLLGALLVLTGLVFARRTPRVPCP